LPKPGDRRLGYLGDQNLLSPKTMPRTARPELEPDGAGNCVPLAELIPGIKTAEISLAACESRAGEEQRTEPTAAEAG